MQQKNLIFPDELAPSQDQLRPYAEAVCRQWGEDCSVIKRVDSGNSATVYEVSISGKQVALKVYEPRFFQGERREVEERRVLDQISLQNHGNPHLIDFIAADEIHDTYFLLMEFFPWLSLEKCLNSVTRSEIGPIISKVASAAEFLEDRGLVHRDIKPANILISEDCKEVKLLDLGVLRTISATEDDVGTDHGYALPFVATAQYSSPAYLFRDHSPTERMWRALTFYQLGAVLHDLVMKKPIFDVEMRSENRYRVAAAVLLTRPKVMANDVDPKLINLARNCLIKDDEVRLQRVSWSNFRGETDTGSEEVRRRLSLGEFRGAPHLGVSSGRRDAEKLRLRIVEATDTLIDLAQHALQTNGFPRATAKKLDETEVNSSIVSFAFRPSNAICSDTHVVLMLRLSVPDVVHLQCDVTMTACLSRGTECMEGFQDEECLWSTTLDDLKLEGQELVQVLGDAFIRHYAVADEQLSGFEEQPDGVQAMVVGGG